MDGGGRFPGSLTAFAAGGAAARRSWVPSLLRGQRRSSVAVPLSRRIPRHLGSVLTVLLLAGSATFGLAQGGHLEALQESIGEPHHALARLVGLGVDQVTISGIAQLTEQEVLSAANVGPHTSLAFLSVAEARERLERLPLVKTASVRKLYPGSLIVQLTEREPYALWQLHGELFVVAADGTVIDQMEDERFAHLPLVVGDLANTRAKDYLALLDAAGPLRKRIRAGTLVSGRRWTLKLDNGVDLKLPELNPARALARAAKLERENRLLDKDVLAIDLRQDDRVTVRLTEEAAAARLELVKKRPNRVKGVET